MSCEPWAQGPLPKVLVVEDSELERLLIRQRLRLDSVELLEAAAGLAAIEIARPALPDLILLDLGLPDLSGFDVIHHLKEDPATRSIPVIFVSGTASVEAKVRGAGPGGDRLRDQAVRPGRAAGTAPGGVPAQVPAGPAGEAGAPRRADRAGEPAGDARAARRRVVGLPTAGDAAVDPDRRRRSLQADQRPLRPCRRRRGAPASLRGAPAPWPAAATSWRGSVARSSSLSRPTATFSARWAWPSRRASKSRPFGWPSTRRRTP